MTDDLLALLVEVTSVSASDRKLRKPITLPRPGDEKKKREQEQGVSSHVF